MGFVKVADVSELPVGAMKKVVVGERTILLANVEGTYYALPNKCPHMGGSLADGQLEGAFVTCPRHGARYDVRSGQVVGDAHILFIKTKPQNALTYPVRMEGTSILVELP